MKISQLTELIQAELNDYLPILDISDQQQGASGSARKIKLQNINTATIVLSPTGSNDHTKIQNAINSLGVLGGGKIFLKAGLYDIGATISILFNNIVIEGEGKLTQLKAKNSLNAPVIKLGNDTNVYTNCCFYNFYINGNSANQVGQLTNGLWINKGQYNIVQNVVANSCDPYGILIDGGGTFNRVLNCEASSSTFDGVTINFSNHNTVIGGVFKDNGHGGVFVKGGQYNIVQGTRNYNSTGIVLIQTSRITVVGNVCTNASGASGISGNDVSDATIIGNVCCENNFDGIRFDGIARSVIKDNICLDNGKSTSSLTAGIHLFRSIAAFESTNNIVKGNFCADMQATPTQDWGILEQNSSNLNEYVDNYFSENINGAISQVGTSNRAKNNAGLNPEIFSSLGNISGSITFDRVTAETHFGTLTDNLNLTLEDGKIAGDKLRCIFKQDVAGNRTLTMVSINHRFAGGSFILTTTGGAVDIIEFVWTGSFWREVSRATNES